MDAITGSMLNYTYDGFGRIRTASRDNTVSICETNGDCPTYLAGTMTYYVNAEGQRDSKSNPNGETVWYQYLPSGQLNSELSNTRGFNYYIYLGVQPIGVIHNPLVNNVNTLYFVQADRMGRPEVITDSAQNKAWTGINYAFDSAPLFTAAVTGIDIGLPVQVNDGETGNWSNGFRDYDSSNGRYLESDPNGLGGGINTYAYVGNNPLSEIDPLGLCGGCTAAQLKAAQLADALESTSKTAGALALVGGIGTALTGAGEFVTAGADTPATVAFASATSFFGTASYITGAAQASLRSFASGNMTALGTFDFSQLYGLAASGAASSIPGLSSFSETIGDLSSQAIDLSTNAQEVCKEK